MSLSNRRPRIFKDSWGVSLLSSNGDSPVKFIVSHCVSPYCVMKPSFAVEERGNQAVLMGTVPGGERLLWN